MSNIVKTAVRKALIDWLEETDKNKNLDMQFIEHIQDHIREGVPIDDDEITESFIYDWLSLDVSEVFFDALYEIQTNMIDVEIKVAYIPEASFKIS